MSRRTITTLCCALAFAVSTAVVAPAAEASPERVLRATGAPQKTPPSAAVPTVEGPIADPDAKNFASYPLSKLGYGLSEYFFSGTATAYSSAAPLASDGRWSVTAASSAPYKSRIVVIRPTDPAKFSGTVVVEWMNVTSGSDSAVDWQSAHDEMLRSGDAYIAVSAQAVGVKQLASSNASRYGSLVHPGDSYSFDIFSQSGMAVEKLAEKILPGMHPRVVIADGQSQSAIRLTTYVDAVAPLTNVFDGYLIHSRAGTAAPLSDGPGAGATVPDAVFIRTDLTVPVLTVLTETDVLGVMGFYPATQPDGPLFRIWEIAGTAHVDAYVSIDAANDDTSWGADVAQFGSMSSPPGGLNVALPTRRLVLDCSGNLNTGQNHYVFQAALDKLAQWASTGTAPPHAPRFKIDTSGASPTYVLDHNGNVRGGVRTPSVDAPLATLSGLPPADAPDYCVFFGQTHPLTPTQLSALYPTHRDFVQQWQRSVSQAERAGFLLPADAKRLVQITAGS